MSNVDGLDSVSAAIEYWDTALSGLDRELILNTHVDHLDAGNANTRLALGNKLSQQLRAMSKGNDLSLYVLLTAISKLLLYRLTQRDRVLVGSPIHREIGSEINAGVPLFSTVREDQSLGEFVVACQSTIVEAYQHQHLSYMSSLVGDAGESVNPFKAVVSLDSVHGIGAGESLFTAHSSDLLFSFSREKDEIVCNLRYRPAVVGTALDAENLLDWWSNVANRLAGDVSCKVSSVGLLSDQQQSLQLARLALDVAPDDLESFSSIGQLIVQRLGQNSEQTALVCGEQELSREVLLSQAQTVASGLRRLGIGNGNVVAVAVPESERQVISMLGIWLAGAVYLPLDNQMPAERTRYMVADSAAVLVITDGDQHWDGVRTAKVEELLASTGEICADWPTVMPTDTSYVIYTSGSTGRPKGVRVAHRGLANLVRHFDANLQARSNDRYLQFASMAFDAAIWETMMGLLQEGGGLYLYPQSAKSDHRQFAAFVDRHQITVATLPPPLISQFEPAQLSSLRRLIVAGSRCPVSVAKMWHDRVEFINAYGPTETTVCASMWTYEPKQMLGHSVPIGRPVLNSKVYILNAASQLQPLGYAGEICVGGSNIALEYLNQPALTRSQFVDSPFEPGEKLYRTGDIGRWTKHGVIEFLGRNDDQIKIRGIRVEVGEIESTLTRHDLISQAHIQLRSLSHTDVAQTSEDVLCAYVTLLTPSGASEAAIDTELTDTLKKYLAAELPEYMIPTFFIVVPRFEVNVRDKIDVSSLPAPQDVLTTDKSIAPENSVQSALRSIWSELLQIDEEKICIDAHFFDIGGNSLNATEMATLIHQKLDVTLELFEIFSSPSIRDLAEIVGSRTTTVHVGIPTAPEQSSYGLSSAQSRLFFLNQLAPESTGYNLPSLHLFEGQLDYSRVEKALAQLIDRHDSLRTQFASHVSDADSDCGAAPDAMQVVLRSVELPIQYMALDDFDLPSGSLAENAYAIVDQCVRPFDLSRAPLVRMYVVKVSPQQHLIVTDAHHIIADGVSVGILVRDFMAFYAGEELTPLTHQYTDFSEWQSSQMAAEDYQRQEDYWVNLLSEEVPRLRIAHDHPRPAIMTFEGDYVELNLDQRLSQRIERFVREHELTHYMFFLAVFNILLHKYSDSEDVTVGTGIAGRSHSDLKELIGMFVNTLIMRNKPARDLGIIEFMQQVRTTSLEAFDHQLVQFDDLVNKLAYERDASRNPIFDFLLVVQNFDMPSVELPGLTVSSLPQPHRTSKFDLTVFVSQKDDGQFQILFEYYTAIFNRSTVTRWSEQFRFLLEQILDAPQCEIQDLALLAPESKQQWLAKTGVLDPIGGVSDSPFAPERPIVELFEAQVAANPQQTAVVYEGRHYPYSHINDEANKIAHFLLSVRGLRPEQPVGLLIDHSHWQVIALLGILKAGGVYLPIESSIPLERMGNIIEDAGLDIVLSVTNHAEVINRLQWQVAGLDAYVLLDTEKGFRQLEKTRNSLGNKELWNYIVENSVDDITGGGWISSYTGLPFTREEMDEYGDSTLEKLLPLLTPQTRILEIGCASGISMYRLAPHIEHYVGTDLSEQTIERNRKLIRERGIENISLHTCSAIDIDQVNDGNFDIVIINSVIQAFDGHNYLRRVIEKCTEKMADSGYLFLGDIMDQDLHHDFVSDLTAFKTGGQSKVPFVVPEGADPKAFVTKTDQSSELSISRKFFEDLLHDAPGLKSVAFSDKIGSLKNELTEFRYDCLFVFDRLNRSAPSTGRHKRQFDLRDLNAQSAANPTQAGRFKPDGRQLAYILFTSGSTGVPKGVKIENRSLVSFVHALRESFQTSIDTNDRFLVHTNQSFDASMVELFVPLVFGATCVVAPKADFANVEALTELMLNERVTACWMPVALLPHMVRLMRESGQTINLNKLATGAEVLKSSLLRECHALNEQMKILNLYGPTEATVYATTHLWTAEYAASIEALSYDPNFPIGTVRPDAQVLILDSQMQQVAPGVIGEVYIGGTGVMRGYLNRPELTESVLREHPYCADQTIYKTGDMASYDEHGCVHFAGREDSQIKLRGMRVELGEIEQQLQRHAQIDQVFALIENPQDPFICAYYTRVNGGDQGRANDELEDTQLQSFLTSRLPQYMVPTSYVMLETIPLRISGKVDHDAMRKIGAAYRASQSDFSGAPFNDAQLKMAKVWAEVLNVPAAKIGLDSDFFMLGGHSLKATQLVSIIKREFKINMSLATVFQSPTLRALSEHCERQEVVEYADIQVVPESDHYELSSSQKSMFVVQSITKGSMAYNMPSLIRVIGAFDLSKAEASFRALIQRHEALRTSFSMIGDELCQTVHPDVDFNIEYVAGDQSREIQSYLADFIRPFDLGQAGLIRARVVEIPGKSARHDKESLLLVDMNHIISDGSSMTVFIEEFADLYNGGQLEPLKIQYRDFAHWQNRMLASRDAAAQEEYWRRTLAHPLPNMTLPLDFERPAIQSFDGDQISTRFTGELVDQIRSVAQAHDVTLFMLLLSSAYIFLNKISLQDDIIIGTSLAGRDHADLDRVMGMFVNTLALRNSVSNDMKISEFIAQVRRNTVDAFDNKQVQFERLVDLLKIKRDPARNPMFDVRFDVHNHDQPEIELNGLEVVDYEPEFKTSKFDLTFDIFIRGDSLLVRVEYCTALFTPETVREFLTHYQLITEYIVRHPDHTIDQIDTLSNLEPDIVDDSDIEFGFTEQV